MTVLKITIPLQPITKKNSQRIVVNGGRPYILPSKQYKQYEKDCACFLPDSREPIDYAVNVRAVYYMKTRRKVDLTNLHEALHDILVHYGILADDNHTIIVGTDGSYVDYDKENPRTEVIITKVEKKK